MKKIMQLYNEFIGEALPEEFGRNWPMRLGTATEQLQLDWFEEGTRQIVSRRGDVVHHPFLNWAAATLDGWIDALECPIECKHVAGREPYEVIVDRYQPQMQWQMEVTGADQCALSVIMGAAQPVVEFIKRDGAYITEMLKRGAQFMEHVRSRTPPVDLPAVPAPIDAKAVYDMSKSNEWGNNANIWLELRDSAAAYDDAAKILKSLVPPDAAKAFGHGVRITRNKVGNLSLRQDTA